MRIRRPTITVLALAMVLAGCATSPGDDAVATSGPTTAPTTEIPSTTSGLPTTTDSPDPPTTASTAPTLPTKPVVVGGDQYPTTLNPYGPGGTDLAVQLIAQALHTGVWDIDGQTLERIPEVVVELPSVANGGVTVNDDGTMTVAYSIRDEAVWADGTPISGQDFAFTYETLVDPAVAETVYAFDENPYETILPDTLEADTKSFRLTMERPTLDHELLFRWLIPQHQVEGTDVLADWNETPWLSGGPFVVDSVDPAELRITLVRNDAYWKVDAATGEPLPHLDEVVFQTVPETDVLLSRFSSGEIDAVEPPPVRAAYEPLEDIDGVALTVVPGQIWEHLTFGFGELNRNGASLNADVRFRRAVVHALDRQELADEALGPDTVALSSYLDVAAPGLSGAAWDRYPHDQDTARTLLAEVCADLGRDCGAEPLVVVFSTTSNADMRPRVARRLEDALGDVGISVSLELEDSVEFFGPTLHRGTFDLGMWAWVASPGLSGVVAIHDLLDPAALPPNGSNFGRWGTDAVSEQEPVEMCCGFGAVDIDQGPSTVIDDHTERYSEIVAEMRTTVDGARLRELIAEAEAILADQVVVIPLFSRLAVGAVWADRIGGYVYNPTQAGHTWNIEEWYSGDER